MRISAAKRTMPGGRKVNEDSAEIIDTEQAWCAVVADGLGGHGGGDHASRCAVDSIAAAVQGDLEFSADALRRYVEGAHQAVVFGQENGGIPSMRTTIAVVLSDRRTVLWAHVGDTRIYIFRDGRVAHQSSDHSVPQMLVDAGDITRDQIRSHPDRSRLLRALGQEEAIPQPTVSRSPQRIEPGDAFLLCSDGWWEYVTEAEMEIDLAKSATPDEWLDHMTSRILSRAEAQHDNYTAIGAYIERD